MAGHRDPWIIGGAAPNKFFRPFGSHFLFFKQPSCAYLSQRFLVNTTNSIIATTRKRKENVSLRAIPQLERSTIYLRERDNNTAMVLSAPVEVYLCKVLRLRQDHDSNEILLCHMLGRYSVCFGVSGGFRGGARGRRPLYFFNKLRPEGPKKIFF